MLFSFFRGKSICFPFSNSTCNQYLILSARENYKRQSSLGRFKKFKDFNWLNIDRINITRVLPHSKLSIINISLNLSRLSKTKIFKNNIEHTILDGYAV